MIKTYLDRKNPDRPYFFISYAHEDKNEVEKTLDALSAAGGYLWYDKSLHGGDTWDKVVQEVINNKNCVGIIYFYSENFTYSGPCRDEYNWGKQLEKERGDFHTYFILLGDKAYDNWNEFQINVMMALPKLHPNDLDKVRVADRFMENFDTAKIYRPMSRDAIDSGENINLLYKEVCLRWGCASDENEKLDSITRVIVDDDYRIKAFSSINEGKKSEEVEWKVFSYSGNTVSAILVSDELFAATSLSFVESMMDSLNEKVNCKDDKTEGKYLYFDDGFLQCINTDEKGRRLRFLRASEHENNYLQLEEALKKTPLNDVVDDGYYFVRGTVDGNNKVLFADRGSPDVYRHIHVDAYASIIPVIDVDFEKLNQYIKNKNKA